MLHVYKSENLNLDTDIHGLSVRVIQDICGKNEN